jgi:transcriptional regulator NrdR family protein
MAPPVLMVDCPQCQGTMMQYVSSRQVLTGWYVELWCPDCEQTRTGTFTRMECSQFETISEAGERYIKASADLLQFEQAEQFIQTFVHAVEHDQVWPEDFNF